VAAPVFDRELVLHDLLRGDAGVVGADLPQRFQAAHALVADQHVHHRLLERMAHVQGAGDVRRRQQDAVRLALSGRLGRANLELAALLPAGVPLRLDRTGLETLFHRGLALRTGRRRVWTNKKHAL
jgi:hypothetical protein